MTGKVSPPSTTAASEKDYWRTPRNLIRDALSLINAPKFSVDVCCSDKSVSIAEYCITEKQDAFLAAGEWIIAIIHFSVIHPSVKNGPFFKKLSSKLTFTAYPVYSLFVIRYSLFVIRYEIRQAWQKYVLLTNCIAYLPDGRYHYLRPDGSKAGSCTFSTALIYIVPHFTNGAQTVFYKRG